MNNLEKQVQQRVNLLESHYREWNEILTVEAEMRFFLKGQQRQKIIQFTKLDLLQPVNIEWTDLMKQQSQERDKFVEFNEVKRQLVRDRHRAEKIKLTSTNPTF
ncbi:hypothetical protein [Spirosoma flavum]|uniref:Uncharacterized protein n=1 Tax=Spirosoma flavum TaxID=2048557 RepID=A0ABW6AJP3_9BACT